VDLLRSATLREGVHEMGQSESAGYELVIRPQSAVSLRDLAELWRYRELLWTLASRDVRVRYKQAALGVLWALIQPVAQMVVFTVVFNRFAGIQSASGVSYPVFCLSGLLIWTMFASGLSSASESLINNASLITKVYFPRVIVPVSAVVPPMVDFTVGFALLLPLMPVFGIPLRPTLLLALPIAALAPLAAVAGGLWLSALNVQFRDVRYALPFFVQLLIFLTPVFYPPSQVPERYRPLLALNPMAAVVEGFRAAVFGEPLPLARLGGAALLIAVVGLAGFAWFRRMERTFADRV
jgi:lipopolysaccharide transport system permease protein